MDGPSTGAGQRSPEDLAAALLAVARDRQTYRNLAYLLLAFPLGLLDAAVLLVAFAGVPALVAGGMAIALDRGGWAGLPLALGLAAAGVAALPGLLPAFAAARAQVDLEGRLARALLGGAVAPVPFAAPAAAVGGPWRRLRARLSDLDSARALAFLLVRLPLGALSLAALAAAAATTLALLAAPLAYRGGGPLAPVGVDSAAEATVCALLAPLAALLGLHLTNAVAWASAELARLLLNPEPQARYAWAVAPRRPSR